MLSSSITCMVVCMTLMSLRLEPKKIQTIVSWFCGKLWRGGTSSRCSVTFLVGTHNFLGEGTTGWYVNE